MQGINKGSCCKYSWCRFWFIVESRFSAVDLTSAMLEACVVYDQVVSCFIFPTVTVHVHYFIYFYFYLFIEKSSFTVTRWCCFGWKEWTLSSTRTFLRAWLVLRPQPRPSVFITSVSAYSRLEKHWFSQLSPAGHTWQQQHKGKKFRGAISFKKLAKWTIKNMHTDLWMTLVLQHAVETLGVRAARMLICWFAVASWDFWQVS